MSFETIHQLFDDLIIQSNDLMMLLEESNVYYAK